MFQCHINRHCLLAECKRLIINYKNVCLSGRDTRQDDNGTCILIPSCSVLPFLSEHINRMKLLQYQIQEEQTWEQETIKAGSLLKWMNLCLVIGKFVVWFWINFSFLFLIKAYLRPGSWQYLFNTWATMSGMNVLIHLSLFFIQESRIIYEIHTSYSIQKILLPKSF